MIMIITILFLPIVFASLFMQLPSVDLQSAPPAVLSSMPFSLVVLLISLSLSLSLPLSLQPPSSFHSFPIPTGQAPLPPPFQ